jgi:hypothetical protein
VDYVRPAWTCTLTVASFNWAAKANMIPKHMRTAATASCDCSSHQSRIRLTFRHAVAPKSFHCYAASRSYRKRYSRGLLQGARNLKRRTVHIAATQPAPSGFGQYTSRPAWLFVWSALGPHVLRAREIITQDCVPRTRTWRS